MGVWQLEQQRGGQRLECGSLVPAAYRAELGFRGVPVPAT